MASKVKIFNIYEPIDCEDELPLSLDVVWEKDNHYVPEDRLYFKLQHYTEIEIMRAFFSKDELFKVIDNLSHHIFQFDKILNKFYETHKRKNGSIYCNENVFYEFCDELKVSPDYDLKQPDMIIRFDQFKIEIVDFSCIRFIIDPMCVNCNWVGFSIASMDNVELTVEKYLQLAWFRDFFSNVFQTIKNNNLHF